MFVSDSTPADTLRESLYLALHSSRAAPILGAIGGLPFLTRWSITEIQIPRRSGVDFLLPQIGQYNAVRIKHEAGRYYRMTFGYFQRAKRFVALDDHLVGLPTEFDEVMARVLCAQDRSRQPEPNR